MSAQVLRRPTLRSWVLGFLGAGVWCLVPPVATGADIDFSRDVYPFLKANCIACHNKTTTKAALNMETPESMRKGGDSGAAIVPGKAGESLILEAAAHSGDLEMPPKGNKSGAVDLTPAQLALLRAWIDQGAKGSVQQTRTVVWQPLPPGVHPIYSVAMTSDGRFAACGRANQVFVYDLATRQFLTRLVDETLATPGTSQPAGVAHRALVQSLAFSPDGTRLASGSFREVKLWRRDQTSAVTRKGDATLGAVVSALADDGTRVVSADKQGTLHVLNPVDGKALKTIPTESKAPIALIRLSPDAATAAVYASDGSLSVWSLTDGRRLAGKDGVIGVHALAWTRDGRAIATAGDDKVVRLWPLPTANKADLVATTELKGASGVITILEAGADPQHLIAAGADGKIRVWNISEAKQVRELTVAGVVALGLSRDGKQLAAGLGNGKVQVWDLSVGKPLIVLGDDVETNRRLASLDWDVARQGLEMTFQGQESARIEAEDKALEALLKKSTDTIATVQKVLLEKQKALTQATEAKTTAQQAVDAVAERVAKAPNGKPDAALEKELAAVREKLMAAVAAETAAMATRTLSEAHLRDAEGAVRNIEAVRVKNTSAVSAAKAAAAKAKEARDKASADLATTNQAAAARTLRPLAVAFSPDGQIVAAAFGDGSLRVWASSSGLPIEHVPAGAPTTAASLAADADGGFVACQADGSSTRVNTRPRWVLERVLGGETPDTPFVDRVNAVRFSPDGKTLATGGGEPSRSGDIILWDVASGKPILTWKERHSDAVLALDFSPDGLLLASGGADKLARVNDLRSGKPVNVFEGHTHHVMGVSFRADGRVLATAGADGAVVVWDMISGERKRKIEGWGKEVTSLQFIGATNQIVTSGGDKLVRIVNDAGGQIRVMPNLLDFMQAAASTPTASVIVGGGEDSLLHVWNGTSGQELATFGAH